MVVHPSPRILLALLATLVVAQNVTQIQLDITGQHKLQLPLDELTLTAHVSLSGEWEWRWSVERSPEGSNPEISGINTKKLHLSKLTPGSYTFAAEVTDPTHHGNGTFELDVLEEVKVNQPPVANIKNNHIELTLPETKVFLIGSDSSDPDGDELGYEWKMVDGNKAEMDKLDELLKKVKLDQADIELDLPVPGNYTFELTVSDPEGLSDSAQASIVVKEERDDPPIANAGQALSINLPQHEVTLCGNSSTDDSQKYPIKRGIVEWKWTADASNEHLTDTVNAQTSCLKVSDIRNSGIYKFNLEVCDVKHQCDQATVQLMVKEPTNIAPIAKLVSSSVWETPETGELIFYISKSLAGNCVLNLDGCGSSDENEGQTLEYEFEQLEGEVQGRLEVTEECQATVREIETEGAISFKLTVTDSGNPPLTDTTTIELNVKFAEPPKIIVPEEVNLEANQKYAVIDASQSYSFDHSNLTYDWRPLEESGASFTVLNESNKKDKIELINFAPGRLVFNLTVTDGQAQSSSELVVVIVEESSVLSFTMEARLETCRPATFQDRTNIADELVVYLREHNVKTVQILDMYRDHASGDTIVLFVPYMEGNEPLSPETALPILLDSFKNSGFKSFCKSSPLHIKSYVCLADCNHHGQCNNGTNTCHCDPFWMPSPFDSQTNCAWSVLYFTLSTIGLTVLLIISGFSFKSVYERKQKKTKKQKRRKNTRYEPLHQDTDSDENYKEMHRLRRKKRKKQRLETKIHERNDEADDNEDSSNTVFDVAKC